MELKKVLHKVDILQLVNEQFTDVNQICFDSRKVTKNTLFVAVPGTLTDGHTFIDKAIASGATVIVCEQLPETIVENITYIQVKSSTVALAQLATQFYGNPSGELQLVGITGTNGKTTVATLLHQLFQKVGYQTGLISTVAVYVGDEKFEATHTTPDALVINQYLKKMVDAGVSYCFMEVSSHGIDQNRTQGLTFAGGVFTNLTHDHLDYHKTFANYRDVKKRFFDQLPKSAFAIVNADDKNSGFMLQNCVAKKQTYALKTMSDVKGQIIESRFDGTLMRVGNHEFWMRLIGEFNAYNALAVYASAILLGLDEMKVLTAISSLDTVKGRFQYAVSQGGIITIVDYAHTPDALKNVLETINNIRTGNEDLITVVGCGGNRDSEKRPVMANIATMLSNQVVLTSDNPRNENPEDILKEMEKGVQPQNFAKAQTITDRRQALQSVCKNAKKGDIILVAGKGHETYQEIKGVKHDFDDFKIVNEFIQLYKK